MERGWFIDAWRSGDLITCWIKTRHGDTIRRYAQRTFVYAAPYPSIMRHLERIGAQHELVTRRAYDDRPRRLVAIEAPVHGFERFVRELERAGRFGAAVYDGDITPEQRFSSERGLWGGCPVAFDETRIEACDGPELPALTSRRYTIDLDGALRASASRIRAIHGDLEATGGERTVLEALQRDLEAADPDAIVMDDAFAAIAKLEERMRAHGIEARFHRFDAARIEARGGRSFFKYGTVVWRDYAVRLRGRLLFDSKATMTAGCDLDGIVELSRLSGAPLQTIGSRSPGSVFQHAIVRDLVTSGRVVAHKSKPLPEPLSMTQLVRSDRAGLSFDPATGFHTNVIELDYEAMFPTLMVQKNISAEKIGHGAFAPDVPIRVDQEGEAIVSRTMRPFVELRHRYKRSDNARERARAKALKGVLVSANGYLRFREFKLGVPTSHVALCAWAREYLLAAKEEGEASGYRLVHGIVDSVYLRGATDQERVDALRARIEAKTGLRIEHEGTFRWIVFLPSKQDSERPVVTRFFGALKDGSVKLRGIEARQKSTCELVRRVQTAIVEHLAAFATYDEVRAAIPGLFADLNRIVARLGLVERELLARSITLSKTSYARETIQRRVLAVTRRAGVPLEAGQRVRYVLAHGGPDAVSGSRPIDTAAYRRLLVRAVASVTNPFGYDERAVELHVSAAHQQRLDAYADHTDTHGSLLEAIGPIEAHHT